MNDICQRLRDFINNGKYINGDLPTDEDVKFVTEVREHYRACRKCRLYVDLRFALSCLTYGNQELVESFGREYLDKHEIE